MVYTIDEETIDPAAFDFASFKHEAEILHVIFYRSRNQHHVSYWWKYFEMIHQRCFQLVDEYEQRDRIRQLELQRLTLSVQNRKGKEVKKLSRKGDRRKPIWVQSKRIGQIAFFLYKKLLPSAYRNFHGMLKQGAFITLGMAIIGLSARLYRLLTPIVNLVLNRRGLSLKSRPEIPEPDTVIEELKSTSVPKEAVETHSEANSFDLGEVISREELESLRNKSSAASTPVAESPKPDEKSLHGSGTKRGAMSLAEPDAESPIVKKKAKKSKDKNGETKLSEKDAAIKDKSKKKKKSKKNAIDSIFGGF